MLSHLDAFLPGDSFPETSAPDVGETRVRGSGTLITGSPLTCCLKRRGLSFLNTRFMAISRRLDCGNPQFFILCRARTVAVGRIAAWVHVRVHLTPQPSLTSPKRRESNISSHPPCKRRGVPLTQGCDGQASYKIVAYRSPLTMTNNQRTRTIAGV